RLYEKYQSGLKKEKKFQVNDIVGLKISDVDRSNLSASILPCKIIEISHKDEGFNTQYKLATMNGIINNWFSSADIIDMSETVSVDLRQLDINILPVITFIQACQAFTKFMPINICKCRGLCNTKRCPRKRQSLLCCTKCHRGKCISCKNEH
ncbi:unnamed protein product, partial [Rotaria sp. Silwood2]